MGGALLVGGTGLYSGGSPAWIAEWSGERPLRQRGKLTQASRGRAMPGTQLARH